MQNMKLFYMKFETILLTDANQPQQYEKQQISTLRCTFSRHTMRKKSEENRVNNKDKKYLHNLKKYLEQIRQEKSKIS